MALAACDKALSRTLKVSGQSENRERGRHIKKKYQSKTGAWPHISQISLPGARPVHALLSASWRLVCGIFCCVRVLTSSRLSNMLPCSVHDPGEEYTNEQQTLHTTKVLHLHGIYTRLYARHPRAPHATPQNMVIPLSNCRRGSDAEAVRIENLISTSTCKGSCTASATPFFDDGVHHFHGGARW